jgi:O-antigen ligase
MCGYGWVQNYKLEMGNFGFPTFCLFVCVCVCVFIANCKLEMGNLGFAPFYVWIWVGTKLEA